jgi:hypothetical protein
MSECVFDEMADVWRHPVVIRSRVGEFSGGLLHARTMANIDSQGLGPSGMFYLSGKAAYPTNELVAWMKEKYQKENHVSISADQSLSNLGLIQSR